MTTPSPAALRAAKEIWTTNDADGPIELIAEIIDKEFADQWQSVDDGLPDEDQPVWMMVEGITGPTMGARTFVADAEGWVWARVYTVPDYTNDKWDLWELEWDDQYMVTHWMYLPMPPKALQGKQP